MSLTQSRSPTTDRTGFMADERAYLLEWGDEVGLEVSFKPATTEFARGDGIREATEKASRLGHLPRRRIPMAVPYKIGRRRLVKARKKRSSLDEALARIIIDTEA